MELKYILEVNLKLKFRCITIFDFKKSIGGEIGETPLHIAARIEEARGEKCTKMLLKSGADTNLAMTDGRTPLHIAGKFFNFKFWD